MARWWLVVALSALLAVPTAVDPTSRLADVTYLVGLAAIVGALWWGPARLPAGDRAPWRLLALAGTAWLAGDTVQRVLNWRGSFPEGPSAPDVFWLASYPLLIAGVSQMVRRRGLPAKLQRDLRLDILVVTLGAFVAAWHVLIAPTISAGGSVPEVLTGVGYPIGDVAVFSLAITLAMVPGNRNTPAVLLMACMALTLPIDLLETIVPESVSDRMDSVLLVVNALLAAAALHPARSRLTRRRRVRGGHSMYRWRIVLLGLSLATVSVVSALPGHDLLRVLPSVVASVAISSTVVLRFYRAVAERERAEAALVHQAHHDQLTGAANRTLLMERLVAAVRGRGRAEGPAILLFLDLDGFKRVNDTWGHPAGDLVLRTVAARLLAQVRAEDTVARVGGDEFVVLCRRTTSAAGRALAERVASAVGLPIDLGPAAVRVGSSIGVVAVDVDDADADDDFLLADDLLRRADTAMYEAKRGGGGVRCADRSMYLVAHPALPPAPGRVDQVS
jgi:diguanylate cyclase (GGDEF)-like protein